MRYGSASIISGDRQGTGTVSRTLFVLGLGFLAGCSNFKDWLGSYETSETKGLIQEVPDGPPLISSVNVATLPEPEAKPEPLSRYGNPESYLVDGVTYKVKPVKLGFEETGIASWYGRKFHGRLTSSGEPFDMFQFTAAHKTIPIPAWIRVTNLENDKSLVVRVNDRGPFKEGRVLDLSWAAAERLGFSENGTVEVSYEVLKIPTANPSLIANPLAEVPQSVFQVTAVSTEEQAQKLASQIRSAIPKEQASVRVESNGFGLFRVQVLPKLDLSIERAIYEKLVMLGWSPQKSIMK
ncbi:MAG TPA: septal ring lytic transglycosylase RlpA family lipoprotein [Gammaproteobacteria bacterium]|nr:septal ring lytic transglycosylase RlpA family lipoprotein [Gammaproteobacteria bacterium]